MKNYEINEDTIAVMPINYDTTRVIEVEKEYIINKSAYKIMDESCQYFGSTYKGRLLASKKMLDCSYKLPILVEESRKIIFFPTKSSLEEDCCWINFNYIKTFAKIDNNTLITFVNDKKIMFNLSKLSLENQISRSARLIYILNKRINDLFNK